MPTTYYGSKDITVSFGGNAVTAYLDPEASIEREAILQNATPFGVAWQVFLDTGSRKLGQIKFGGVEQFQSSTNCRAYFAEGTSGSLVVTYGGAKTTTVTCIVQKYTTKLATEKLHVFEVVLQPTGTVTEA